MHASLVSLAEKNKVEERNRPGRCPRAVLRASGRSSGQSGHGNMTPARNHAGACDDEVGTRNGLPRYPADAALKEIHDVDIKQTNDKNNKQQTIQNHQLGT